MDKNTNWELVGNEVYSTGDLFSKCLTIPYLVILRGAKVTNVKVLFLDTGLINNSAAERIGCARLLGIIEKGDLGLLR